MIKNVDDARDRIKLLNYYTKLYDEGHPQISDKEWDDLYFELEEYEKRTGFTQANSPTQHISFETVSQLKKVEHNHPMLSLAKTKNLEDVENFVRSNESIMMAKMDGLTCSICYIDGKLSHAETRGNGLIGEDVTHNIIATEGVPLTIPTDEKEVVIDGEVICTYENFKRFEGEYANPRNFAAGSLRLLDAKEYAQRHLTFVAWDCVKGLEKINDTLSNKFFTLDSWFFNVVPYLVLIPNMYDLEHAVKLLKLCAEDFEYPIDGLVIKYNDCEYYNSLGATSHHFRGGLAYKFYDDTYPTHLKYIEWTMGRMGQLTPVAIFDPVQIDGTTVERASLHNVTVMQNILGPCAYVGEYLEIYKANQIIPQVDSAGPWYDYNSVIKNGGISANDIPEKCPYCGADLILKQDGVCQNYYCTNSNCDGKLINRLDHFCGKKGLDIKGLSKATLQKLINWGWVEDFWSIFTLYTHRDAWVKKPGFGPASVNKILDAIETSKDTELWRVIAAAGIPEIGVSASRILARYYKTWTNFRAAVDNNEDFSHLEDFGYVMNMCIHNYDYSTMDVVATYLRIRDVEKPTETLGLLADLQFCITGKVVHWKNRDELKKYILEHGGKVTDSVTTKTDYLINNDPDSKTSKNLTAKKLNKPIITEKDFLALIDDRLAF